MSKARVTIDGFVAKDPESRMTGSGLEVATFSLPVSYKENGDNERTDWYRISVFGKQAKFVTQYVRKGDRVLVLGTLKSSQFTGKDGQTRTSLEVAANELDKISSRTPPAEAAVAPAQRPAPAPASVYDEHDDLPF